MTIATHHKHHLYSEIEKKKNRTYTQATVRDMYRTIYALDANYIASACSPMTPLDLQQLFMCHNDHMWLSRTVPCCIYTISRSDMAYGDSLGQCVCRLWYGITSWNSSINMQVHARTVIWAQNGYTVLLHVPDCKKSKIYQNDQCGNPQQVTQRRVASNVTVSVIFPDFP